MNPLISVIMPVYKVEPYLRKCIGSIISQTYRNLEIILVDDGSPDSCGAICEEYAANDSRICVIHQENMGLSVARNTGLDIAAGEFIFFIDSDDYISEDCIEALYNAIVADNSDCAVTNLIHVDEKTNRQKTDFNINKEHMVFTTLEALSALCYQKHLSCSACGKLYRADLFNGIRYPKGLLSQDYATTYKIFAKCDKVTVIPDEKYFYVKREGSIVNSKYTPARMAKLDISDEMLKFMEENFPECYNAAVSRLVWAYFHVYFKMPRKDAGYDSARKRIEYTLKKYRSLVLRDKNSRRNIRYACLLSYFGFRFVYYIGRRFQG